MNIIRALLVVSGCLTLGEAAVWTLGLKLPGSIADMGLLFVALQAGWVKLSRVGELANILMANLTLFLVPPCVAVISCLDVIANDWFPTSTATIVNTVYVLLVMGKAHEWVRRLV